MPRKSITLNGFAGGLNKDASTYDIISEGQGKDEIPGNIDGGTNDGLLNCYIDDKGKATTAFISPIASILTEDASNNTTSVDLVINNDIAYRNDGVYSIGNDVNWSGNTDYQATEPTGGVISTLEGPNTDPGQVGRKNIGVQFNRDEDILLFIGRNAKGGNGLGLIMDCPGFQSNPNNAVSSPGKYMALAGDSDDDQIYNENDANGNPYGFYDLAPITGSATAAGSLIRIGDYNSSGTIGYRDWSGTTSQMAVYTAGVIEGYRPPDSNSANNKREHHISFKGGRTLDVHGSTSISNGYYGVTFPDISGMNICVEIKLFNTAGLDGLYVWADSHEDNMHFRVASSELEPNGRMWKVTVSDLINAGCVDDFQRIIIPYESAYYDGPSFASGNVRRLNIGVIHSETVVTTDSLPKVWEIREFSFTKARIGAGWNGKKLKLFHTFNYKGVEGKPYEFTQNDIGSWNNGQYWAEDGIIHCASEEVEFQFFRIDYAPLLETEGKFYYQEVDDDLNDIGGMFLLAKYKGSTNNDAIIEFADNLGEEVAFTQGNTVTHIFEKPPIASTYAIESGYPSDTTELNALWKTAAVVGRQVYIGNIKQPINASTYDTSKILKAPINKPAGFSDKSFIDIELGGTEITVMETSGDRLFVFTKTRLIIINVAQDIEFLEATMDGYGVKDARKVIKIAEGLAFVNGNGVHYFDGQKMTTLTDEKMSNYSWGDSYAISYFHPKKLLIIWRGDSYGYMYSFRSNSWCNKFALPQGLSRPNTNSVTADDSSFTYYFSFGNNANDAPFDNELLVLGGTATGGTWGDITDGINSSSTPNIDFRLYTGFIDCGSPGRRKRFYKFKVRVINARYLKWDYRIIGENLNTNSAQANYGREESSASGQIAEASIVNGTVDLIINDATVGKQGTAIALRIYDHYNAGESSSYTGTHGPGADMVIEDITLIYREKTVK